MQLIPFKAVPLSYVNDLNKTIKKRGGQMTLEMKANNPGWEGAVFERYRRWFWTREQWEEDI